MKIHTCIASALILLLAGEAGAGALTNAANERLDGVRSRIQARDCSGAVARLKSGLDAGYPEMALLAGTMYEHGICVKRDWDTATGFYIQAHEGGQADASGRLAAGYADPANGPDHAAALWWSRHGSIGQLDICGVVKQAGADPDAFVAALAAWPRPRLEQCTYVAGVLAMIAVEVKYPQLAQAYSIGGEVTLRFLPGVPRIELQRGDAQEYALLGWVDGDAVRDRRAKKVSGGFETAIGDVANRALRRYRQPAGIPADALLQIKYSFVLE